MDTGVAETPELEPSPSDCGNLNQTLDNQSRVLFKSSSNDLSNTGFQSTSSAEALDDQSDSALFFDAETHDNEENVASLSSPVNTVPAYSFSHWSFTRWDSHNDAKIPAFGWSNWPSVVDSKSSTSYLSEPAPLQEEIETVPAVNTIYVPQSDEGELKPAMVGAGLSNLGNTCFLNAILQCFTHTVPLVQGLRSYNHPRPCDRDSEGFCVFCALHDHIELSMASMGRVVSPWEIVGNLSYISSDFRRHQQEDAHELLQCLLDRLDSCCNKLKTNDAHLPTLDENLVNRVFGGRLVSKLQCCNCGHCSDTYEPLIDLSLEIENVDSLPSALESFTKVERIEDAETQFVCENCEERVSVEKQLILDQAPSIAAFHLKRFKNDRSYVEKIDKHVEFPLELDLMPYTSCNQIDVELKYDLYAIVVHVGFSSTSGHYYCFIRSAPDAWYRLDDSKDAYILFYAKQGTSWFTTFMETEKLPLASIISNNSPKSVLDNTDHINATSPSMETNVKTDMNEEATGKAVESSGLSFDDCGHDDGVNVAKDDCNSLVTPELRDLSNSVGTSSKFEKFSPSALGGNNCNQRFDEAKNSVDKSLSTLPRSPSPDIYAQDPSAETYSMSRDHLMTQKQLPCKRQLDKPLEDLERNLARRLVRTMPSARRLKLLAALSSESSMNSKRTKRIEPSSNRKDRPLDTRHKPNLSPYMRSIAAGSFR